ncbi:hypothetical protein APHAL10511_004821 [Amanita phalloides]|nr:hypothetical protein APHAL10511_004821 [Amanita phalloides]
MRASTPTKDYVALRNPPTMSPSYRPRYCTPPRMIKNTSAFDTPLHSPLLRQRPLFPAPSDALDTDDLFSQSPYKPSALAQNHLASYPSRPQPIPMDDDEGSIFLSSSTPSFIPVSLSQPLRTPIKQAHGTAGRPALSVKHLNTPLNLRSAVASANVTHVGAGTKRKQCSQTKSTPVQTQTFTPLKVAASKSVDPHATACFMFDKLAPLEAPTFTTRTPQTKAETEAYLRRQTATLTKLKLADLKNSDDEFSLDPRCDLDDESEGFKLPARGLDRITGHRPLASRGRDKEVAEAVSPGGHIIKRRARSRPVSSELFESILRSSSSPNKAPLPGTKFPASRSHGRSSSGSSMESTSPKPRKRTSGAAHPYVIRSAHSPIPARASMNRVGSGSSASLFFGPSIPDNVPARSRTKSNATPVLALRVAHPIVKTRHSHSGLGNDRTTWNTIQTRAVSPSPDSSPARLPFEQPHRSSQDDEDMFFGSTMPNSSFQFCVTEGTPSPRQRRLNTGTLQRKYRLRDSGVVISDDEDGSSRSNGDQLPPASTSAGSLYSDADDGLVTPGAEFGSGWPGSSIFVRGTDDNGLRNGMDEREVGTDVDAFIMRTLSTTSKGANVGTKKAPDTPVKKHKTTFLGIDRPWQSAVAPKVGLRYQLENRTAKVPRKSLPAVFPDLMRKHDNEENTDSDGEDDSPIARREKYSGLGLGRPQPPLLREALPARTRLLMRRSSSGAFSSGSDSTSMVGTPTRSKDDGNWKVPLPLSTSALRTSTPRTSSNTSSASSASTVSPTKRSRPSCSTGTKRTAPRASSLARRVINTSGEERPGRFERDFDEIDELGSGEFGKVIKVRSKKGYHGLYAIKKSKRFEGPKHRLRLREEVDILKHLAHHSGSGLPGRHPNVLAYIDSWEEDEALYIQTELCESGNLAHFLWEYGRVFPRLDEARVWKIIVDLSNGLRFIHDAGVIHLDLKPSNIFLTKDGRFKIGDFGMASLWPRKPTPTPAGSSGFEREGDKLYLAPEVLQGRYGKAADIFSLGMTILETASNIVVPDQGEAWHRLRQEDFSQVDLDESPELLDLIKQLMRTDPTLRIKAQETFDHPIVSRARTIMERTYTLAVENATSIFAASPLASVPNSFLVEILAHPLGMAMDTSA